MANSASAAIDARYEAMRIPVEEQMKQAKEDYLYDRKLLKNAKEGQDAEAWRSYQRQRRTTPDVVSAAGGHGGMVDSAVAFNEAKYQEGRNSRSKQYLADLAARRRDYDRLRSDYQSQLAQYEAQARAEKAEQEYQAALGRNSGGGGGGGGGYSYSNSTSNNYTTADTSLPGNATANGGTSFYNDYKNKSGNFPSQSQQMLTNTTAGLLGYNNPYSTGNPFSAGGSSTAPKKKPSNLASLDKYI